MNKKFLFFTSAAIMCMACPAMAENFPGDGNMLENKTYDNAATYTNTGIYEGTVVANADYSLNPYSVAAGSYFTGIDNSTNQATTAQCTSGNYCPGVASTTFDNNAFGDTGLRACPANYSGSAAGATANTDCYRACSTTDVAKSATVSGQMYYDGTSSDGVNACSAETCVAGWHKKNGLNLATMIGDSDVIDYGTVDSGGSFHYQGMNSGVIHDPSFYDLDTNNYSTWSVYFDNNKGMVTGQARCSARAPAEGTWTSSNYNVIADNFVNDLTDDPTQAEALHCYCKVTGYKPAGGTLQSFSSSPWVYSGTNYKHFGASACWTYCEDFCYNYAMEIKSPSGYISYHGLRAAILGSVPAGPATCEANTINITWNDASAEDIAATGAATTVYEGDIKTPLKAVTKPGKTFVGWKFIKPAATPVEP